jgi:hypothetical protein
MVRESTKIESKKSQEITILILLAGREARGSAQNQWAVLCAAHQMVGKKPLSQVLVGMLGFEPRTPNL